MGLLYDAFNNVVHTLVHYIMPVMHPIPYVGKDPFLPMAHNTLPLQGLFSACGTQNPMSPRTLLGRWLSNTYLSIALAVTQGTSGCALLSVKGNLSVAISCLDPYCFFWAV